MSQGLWIAIAVIAVLVIVALIIGSVRYRQRRVSLRSAPGTALEAPTPADRSGGYTASSGITFTQSSGPATAPAPLRDHGTGRPGVGDDAAVPRDSVRRPISDLRLPEPEAQTLREDIDETVAPEATEETAPPVSDVGAIAPPVSDVGAIAPPGPDVGAIAPPVSDVGAIAPPAGRLERLRGRLAKSQNAFGRSLLGLLGGGDLDEDSWEEIEDTLLVADLGPVVTTAVVAELRAAMAANSVRAETEARAVLRAVLVDQLHPELDRSIKALPHADKPSVLLVVGVNGTGKTTTVGKLARVLVADGRRVVLGAADTFRAAAADQLQTWASRVGAEVVRGREGADPASVAFDAVDTGIASGADVVVVDTAGRLHTKTGLMDELGKVKRVVEKRAAVDEVLLVLDATIGQNGLVQARVFADVVDITGVVLTKLDGTAKGGIVFRVQQELGVPVKLVGLGEGPDDLAPFEPDAFVDALLG